MTWQDIPSRSLLGLAYRMRNSDRTSVGDDDALRHIAVQVADCFADSGYAFVEEDQIDGLAATLRSFLELADIPVIPPDVADQ